MLSSFTLLEVSIAILYGCTSGLTVVLCQTIEAAENGSLPAFARLFTVKWETAKRRFAMSTFSMLVRRFENVLNIDPSLFRFATETSVSVALASKIMCNTPEDCWKETLMVNPYPVLRTLASISIIGQPFWTRHCPLGEELSKSPFFEIMFATIEQTKSCLIPLETKPAVIDAFIASIVSPPRPKGNKKLCNLLSQRLILPTLREMVFKTHLNATERPVRRSWDLFRYVSNTLLDHRSVSIIAAGTRALTPSKLGKPIKESLKIWLAFLDEVEIFGRGSEILEAGPAVRVCDNMKIEDKVNPCIWMVDISSTSPNTKLGISTFALTQELRQFVIGVFDVHAIGGTVKHELKCGTGVSKLDIPIDFNMSASNLEWTGYTPGRRHPELFKECPVM
ncbi:hypothetical protein EST38_g9597 [Candolleomyces aberdarensis]|uniref:Uncharacterized protein n=1 Tax=Candolleomyces aberdarensis TaxID=2316362 RepID=A0A4V1Q2U0_9AGAR|nr:hypothetical protein EST38_g9597 [Candolleomyces aberdarensis]